MKHLNAHMITGLCIHLFLCLVLFLDPEKGFMGFVVLPFVLGNLAGLALLIAGYTKAGARTFMISSLAFVPIGLIAVFGARKVLDQLKKEAFLSSAKTQL